MLLNRRIWIGLLIATSVALSATLDGAGTAWRQIRGDHFVLHARAGVKDLPAVACDLERVAGALQKVYGEHASTGASASVIAVDNERDLRELLPQFWEHRGARPLGAYWSGLYGHHIVIRADVPPRERVRRILHEYGHFATHLAYGAPPPWLDEGLSELWTNGVITGDEVEIGQPVSAHLKMLRAGADWIPVRELVTAATLPPASEPKTLARFYAESWALVHYLMFERGGGRVAFERTPGPETLPTDAVLQRYIKQSRLPTMKIALRASGPAATACAAVDVRGVDPVEGLIQEAQALADGERPAAALPLLRQAAALAPGNSQVTEMTGVVQFLGNQASAAAVTFDRLIAAGTASYVSYYYRAVLADAAPKRSDGSGAIPVADYLRRAVRLEPGFAPARERLAAIEGRR